MIDLQKITKIYNSTGESLVALYDVNLHVEKGEFTSIMGASGSGKSTLMNILGCLDKKYSGTYILNGNDVSGLSKNELAKIRNKEIGFVFQAFNLLPRMTILDNVELPMTYARISYRERRKKALEALDRVGLSDRIKHRPGEISGGQKQRVAIARAIVNNPSVLMADEPTGNLDSKVTEEILTIFQALNDEGVTLLVVTHEKDVASHSKRIVTFKDGKIISAEPVTNRIIAGGETA